MVDFDADRRDITARLAKARDLLDGLRLEALEAEARLQAMLREDMPDPDAYHRAACDLDGALAGIGRCHRAVSGAYFDLHTLRQDEEAARADHTEAAKAA